MRNETFARPLLGRTGAPSGEEPDKLELSADWRAHPPVMLAVGPVLHPDDAVANKMCALFGRAEARDFLDVDAVIQSSRYTRQRLLSLAAAADRGFNMEAFTDALGALQQITDADFDFYGTSSAELTAMRERFAQWRSELQRQL
jgi:predicted nucleotidyltransferase component of viral defense system